MKIHKMWRFIQDNGHQWPPMSHKPEVIPNNWTVQRIFVLK